MEDDDGNGKRKREEQGALWIAANELPQSGGHPFYVQVNRILDAAGFDRFVEKRCRGFYADKMGRPSLPPTVYFRLLLIGYFEGIDSERGIGLATVGLPGAAAVCGVRTDGRAGRSFDAQPHRRLIDVETHQEIFVWVLQVLARHKLLDGKTTGVDATTLEANAALRSIVRRDTKESYQEFLTRLAKASGSRLRRARTWCGWTRTARTKAPIRTGNIRTIRTRRSPR